MPPFSIPLVAYISGFRASHPQYDHLSPSEVYHHPHFHQYVSMMKVMESQLAFLVVFSGHLVLARRGTNGG